MTPERYEYQKAEANGRKPSVEVHLPLGFKYLEVPLNRLVLRLDIAEERETRIERLLNRIALAQGLPLETPA
jgi:hypothetical protein